MAPRTSKPRDLPRLRPEPFLMLSSPLARPRHPVFVYLRGLGSANSQRVMRRAMERIAELLQIPVEDIYWWAIPDRYLWSIREELGTRYSHATCNQSLSALRGVVGVAHEMGLVDAARYQLVLDIPLFSSSPPTPRPTPSKRQIARLIGAAGRGGDPKGLRDAALLGVLAATGLKRSEVVALRLADLEPKAGRLTIAGESMRLGPEERALLRAWISYRGRGHGPLFLPMRKSGRLERRQMSGEAIAQVVAERAAQAGLGRLSPEDLRRAYLASRP